MKRLLLVFALECSLATADAATLWQEDFSGYTNVGITGLGPTNYPGGTTNWSIDVVACATLTPGSGNVADCFMAVSTSGGRMEAVNVDGEAVWFSAVINISGYTNVSLSVATSETGSSTSTNKYVKLFYRLDSGAEIAFAVNPVSLGNWTNTTAAQSNLYGSTVQIVARMNNPNAGDKSILDGITVSGDRVVAGLPPVLDPIGNREIAELGILSFAISASDPTDNDPVTLTATGLPAGAVFTNSVFVWSNAAPAGVYSVTFRATNKAGADSETVTITVAAVIAVSSRVAGNFYGWSGDTIFKLINGQFWQQSAAGSKTVSPALSRPYITITNYLGYQRRMTVTNVTGYVAVVPLAVTESAVTNTFTGLRYQNTYLLADGTIWKQTSFEVVSCNISSITAWRWIKDGKQILRFLDRNDLVIGTCTVEAFVPPADIKIHSTVAGYFYGFGHGNILRLADGSWWKQISFERSTAIRRNPEVLLWSESGTDYLEMPDEGCQISAKALDVQGESIITNVFTGLHYGNTYRLADGSSWLQLSFENISTNVSSPTAMLWIEESQTNMLVHGNRDAAIGFCVVADPVSDSDSDGQSNAAEVLAGFDPLNSQSQFELRQTDRHVLSWDAVEGRVYTIEWSPSLTERFHPLETSLVWPQNSWTDTVHAVESRGFYRIGVRLAE
ncbi:MAG: hypothetical protein WCG03_08785 [Kiritimatiellales bacterium]